MTDSVKVKDVILGYEYVNGGIWCIRELSCVELNGEEYTEEWHDLICEMPLYNPNNSNAEAEEEHIDKNAKLIIRALNALNNMEVDDD